MYIKKKKIHEKIWERSTMSKKRRKKEVQKNNTFKDKINLPSIKIWINQQAQKARDQDHIIK